jgi:predicted MFS family arabinose efflux permease
MSLYEAAFAVVIATTPPVRRTRALLAITVVAGFASSIFFPLTALLLAHFGWRHTLLALAGLLALVAIPIHALVVPRHAQPAAHRGDDRTGEPGLVGHVLRERRFWQVTGAFVVVASANSSLGILLVTYLIRSGHPPTTAATLAGLLGVLSVTGRVLATGVADRVGMPAVVCGVFAIQAAGVIALPWLGRSTAGAGICVAAYGLGFGVSTIARPAILAETYGTRRYATIAATMAVPVTTAMAFAPLGAAALPPDVFVTVAGGLCLCGAVLLGWALHPLRRVEAVRPGAPA